MSVYLNGTEGMNNMREHIISDLTGSQLGKCRIDSNWTKFVVWSTFACVRVNVHPHVACSRCNSHHMLSWIPADGAVLSFACCQPPCLLLQYVGGGQGKRFPHNTSSGATSVWRCISRRLEECKFPIAALQTSLHFMQCTPISNIHQALMHTLKSIPRYAGCKCICV